MFSGDFSYFHKTTRLFARMRSTNPYSKGSDEEVQFLFGSIFKKHHAQLQRLAYSVTKSQEQASDIVQDVFLKLWEHRDELHHIEVIDAWLHRAVKNKLIDHLRKASADKKMKTFIWNQIEQAQHNPDLHLDAKESGAIINQAVEELPAQRKLVYLLNRETGLSYQEIAQELSISRHTVKNQLSLALRFLQKKFSFQ